MPGRRVLVVDDSVVVRRVLSELLASEPGIESVTTASNGRLALDKLGEARPDLVILDVEMPELDGLATLKLLTARAPNVPVLMFSAVTERAGTLTLDALALGARDYITKPASVGPAPTPVDRVKADLLAKTRALLGLTTTVPVLSTAKGGVSAPLGPMPLGGDDLLGRRDQARSPFTGARSAATRRVHRSRRGGGNAERLRAVRPLRPSCAVLLPCYLILCRNANSPSPLGRANCTGPLEGVRLRLTELHMPSEELITGTMVRSHIEALRERVGPAAYEQVLSEMTTEQQEELGLVTPLSWVRIATLNDLYRRLGPLVGLSLEELHIEIASLVVGKAVTTVWRALLRLTTDDMLISRSPVLFKRAYQQGRLEVRRASPGHAQIEVLEWPSMSDFAMRGLRVGIESTLRAAGRKNPRGTARRTPGGAVLFFEWK